MKILVVESFKEQNFIPRNLLAVVGFRKMLANLFSQLKQQLLLRKRKELVFPLLRNLEKTTVDFLYDKMLISEAIKVFLTGYLKNNEHASSAPRRNKTIFFVFLIEVLRHDGKFGRTRLDCCTDKAQVVSD